MTNQSRSANRFGRTSYAVLAAGFALFLAYGSLVPFDFQRVPLGQAVAVFTQSIRFPLRIISRMDFVTNILLTIPLGYLLLAALRTDRPGWLGRIAGIVVTLLACLGLSTAVEFAQSFFPSRNDSFSDIVAQAAGAVIGVSGWLAVGDEVTRWLRETLAERERPALAQRVLLAYTVVFALTQVMPLDLTLSLAELGRKYRAGGIVIIPFTWSYASLVDRFWDVATDVLLNVPLGAAAVLSWTYDGTRRRPLRAAAIGIIAVAGIEFAQVFVHSRIADATDVITGSIGVLIGVMLATRFSGRTAGQPGQNRSKASAWPMVGVVVWLALLVSYHWNPFDFTLTPARITQGMHQLIRVPFYSYWVGTPFHAFTEVSRKVMLTVPLGVLLELSWARGGRLPGVIRWGVLAMLGLCMVGAIELGQVLLPTRIPDITDVLMGEIGVLAGMWLTARIAQSK